MSTLLPEPLSATVVITTKDRADDLHKALESCFMQSVTAEVIVIDDASSDNTAELVRSKFPEAILVRHPQPQGYITGRNEAARLANGDIIFSIDDDAIFTTPNVIKQVLAEFNDSRIGAIAIPYVDVNKSPEVRQLAPDTDHIYCTDRYIGTAHAVRKDLFLALNGYRECYFHQGEERDFCLRLLDQGYFVKLGRSDVIHHFESPKRDTRRMDLYGRRNDILFAWLNIPWQALPHHLVGTTLKGLWFGFRVKRPLRMLHGLCMGYLSSLKFRPSRQPVHPSTVSLFRKLQKSGPMKTKIAKETFPSRKMRRHFQEN